MNHNSWPTNTIRTVLVLYSTSYSTILRGISDHTNIKRRHNAQEAYPIIFKPSRETTSQLLVEYDAQAEPINPLGLWNPPPQTLMHDPLLVPLAHTLINHKPRLLPQSHNTSLRMHQTHPIPL